LGGLAECGSIGQRVNIPLDRSQHEDAAYLAEPEATHLKFSLQEGSTERPFPVLVRLAAGYIRRHEENLRKSVGMRKRARQKTASV
jgi:hypothetical protein